MNRLKADQIKERILAQASIDPAYQDVIDRATYNRHLRCLASAQGTGHLMLIGYNIALLPAGEQGFHPITHFDEVPSEEQHNPSAFVRGPYQGHRFYNHRWAVAGRNEPESREGKLDLLGMVIDPDRIYIEEPVIRHLPTPLQFVNDGLRYARFMHTVQTVSSLKEVVDARTAQYEGDWDASAYYLPNDGKAMQRKHNITVPADLPQSGFIIPRNAELTIVQMGSAPAIQAVA